MSQVEYENYLLQLKLAQNIMAKNKYNMKYNFFCDKILMNEL